MLVVFAWCRCYGTIPWSKRNCTSSVCPAQAASDKAVNPLVSVLSTWKSFSSQSFTCWKLLLNDVGHFQQITFNFNTKTLHTSFISPLKAASGSFFWFRFNSFNPYAAATSVSQLRFPEAAPDFDVAFLTWIYENTKERRQGSLLELWYRLTNL